MKKKLSILLSLLFLCGTLCFAQDVKPIQAKEGKKSTFVQSLESVGSFATKVVKQEQKALVNPELGLVESILDFAKDQLGIRYRSGGKGPSGFDCSGFVGYVYRHFGFDMGASSRDQYQQGEAVSSQNLKPGDLVFFSGSRKSKTRVGHVGLVVSVNSTTHAVKFIHSASGIGIKIDEYPDGGYYSSRYIGAKRLIK